MHMDHLIKLSVYIEQFIKTSFKKADLKNNEYSAYSHPEGATNLLSSACPHRSFYRLKDPNTGK